MSSIATLTSSNFLRVADKFFSEFILYDHAVGTTTRLLYATLFRYAKNGVCQLPQDILGRFCDCCPRSIQTHLRMLSALQYIRIEPRSNGRNAYRLLLSERARFFIAQAASDLINVHGNDQGEEFSPEHAKNLRMGGENFSPSIRNKKSINTPLSPPHSHARMPPLASLSLPLRDALSPQVKEGGILFHSAKSSATAYRRSVPRMRFLNASTRPIRARRPKSPPAPHGINSGDAARFRPWKPCWRPWIASGLAQAGTGSRAALCRSS